MPRPPKPLNPYASWVALFGATVQRLRVQLRPRPTVTQAELGRHIGYSGSTVSAIERGMIRPDQKFVENCERELPAAGA
jgi:DNA-binding XRE family transcriptional regulator